MDTRTIGVTGNMENYKMEEFKRAMQKYEGASCSLYVPKSKKESGILKGVCGYYQVLGYALLYRIGDVPYSNAYLAEEENVMQNYDEFEERMEKGFFFCALALIADVKSKRDGALKYALFAYDLANIKDSKLNCYRIDKALFDLIFELTKKAGDSFGWR